MSWKTETGPGTPGNPVVDILMYHSISRHGGPTSIPPETFRAQMEVIAESECSVITLDDMAEWMQGGPRIPGRSVILTFDDAFHDFVEAAMPVLEYFRFTATVFVPTGRVGATENWAGATDPPRMLMGWDDIRALSAKGIRFGAHTVTHPDLSSLRREDQVEQLTRSQHTLEDRLGQPVRHFAPPYGRTNAATREAMSDLFETSCGTRLGRADRRSHPLDLPRLEMFYFLSRSRFARHLDGRGAGYLWRRRQLRAIRKAVMPR